MGISERYHQTVGNYGEITTVLYFVMVLAHYKIDPFII